MTVNSEQLWERVSFDAIPQLRNDFDETLNLELLLQDYPHANFNFDPTMEVVSANTQFTSYFYFWFLRLVHRSHCQSDLDQ